MTPKQQQAAEQYLSRYGHAVDCHGWTIDRRWQHVLILPVCGEDPTCVFNLMQHNPNASPLMIVLLNHPKDHHKSALWHQQNQLFKDTLQGRSQQVHGLDTGHQLLLGVDGCDVLLLDFNERPFDPNKGVGLARKIAADTALRLMLLGHIESPWIHSTDADVTLPADYFSVTQGQQAVALSLAFEHHSDDPTMRFWQNQYDFKLHYYRQGVQYMGARYAYIPLGSTLVMHAAAYSQVRGFPCRSGGEDFYVLNKLAKVGPVINVNDVVVRIQSRVSDRVPFGTGPAIKQLQQASDKDEAVCYYHPSIFHVLKKWREGLLAYHETQQLPADDHGLNQHWQLSQVLPKNRQQSKTTARWYQFVHEWFDAFKILKSVHFLQAEFAPVSHAELLQRADYLAMVAGVSD